MNAQLTIALDTTPEQTERLIALQAAFAQACNALAPLVQQTRTWNRVTLHHLAYRMLRERFPHIGSQMACNAIYSVSRTSRQVFQHPGSPFNIARLGDRKLPLLNFTGTAPVYFDRHTISVRNKKLSMYTLDGRMHFSLALHPEAEAAFHERKLREIVLSRDAQQRFHLTFSFSAPEEDAEPAAAMPAALPDYVMVEATQ
ncbi:hypothetical protein [Ramlibacter albus]|uniref:Uncharacterized protein n=1 Tax=Ramlibacter albus TaxID=2079448 RepID=A0A923S1X3_9BURK|nr:hypothetical protein [Ramlibacter albus]MBC5764736.1 hypothetical protein [Ramlibacter albus]